MLRWVLLWHCAVLPACQTFEALSTPQITVAVCTEAVQVVCFTCSTFGRALGQLEASVEPAHHGCHNPWPAATASCCAGLRASGSLLLGTLHMMCSGASLTNCTSVWGGVCLVIVSVACRLCVLPLICVWVLVLFGKLWVPHRDPLVTVFAVFMPHGGCVLLTAVGLAAVPRLVAVPRTLCTLACALCGHWMLPGQSTMDIAGYACCVRNRCSSAGLNGVC